MIEVRGDAVARVEVEVDMLGKPDRDEGRAERPGDPPNITEGFTAMKDEWLRIVIN